MGQTPGLNLAARLFGYVMEKNIIHLRHGEIHFGRTPTPTPKPVIPARCRDFRPDPMCSWRKSLKKLLHVFANKWLIEDTTLLALGN